jgi:membrane-bound lytic murein transglycosylase D
MRMVFALIILFVLALLLFTPKKSFRSFSSEDVLVFAGDKLPISGIYLMNQEKFDREVALTVLQPAQLVMIYKRWNHYIPHIERELKKANIPHDFIYLVIAESSLRNTSVSTAGAAGIWQFMPDTARRYGLRVDDKIDERYDFVKATDAAIRYIKDLYAIFGDWILVAAAYNRGENGLQRDMAWQFVDKYEDALFNNETARYVYRILALKHVFENLESYVDPVLLGNRYPRYVTRNMRVGALDNIAQWARDNSYSYLQIRELNPWIRSNQLPAGDWELQVWR